MELGDILDLSYQDLSYYTDNFSESNYLGHFQFGKLYRGKIVHAESTRYVMVKIWEVSEVYTCIPGYNEIRLMLYGYCYEGGHLGVVYDFKPFDSVFNLIPKDDFTWLQRIKVSLQFASLLKFLHGLKCPSRFIVQNLDCAHIVLNEDYNPKLCDFGLITGGIFPDKAKCNHHHLIGCNGYVDLATQKNDSSSDKQDVFAFGTILLSLISKRVYTEEDRSNSAPYVCQWAYEKFIEYEHNSDTGTKKPKFTVVHQSLEADPYFEPSDGHKITALALKCVVDDFFTRPTMKQVLKSLLNLKAVKKNADFVGTTKIA
ncbi:hypothetical protein MIMGU_mgv1a010357mg [Erythranthe guttata]|uniref:Protein kinase domain-containing protein n=1 Tax=Erythranthe guttata TaxID=4155 RepID=A0A022RS50_ERYGU|nr:hypothetical protein MIMGU_mgv1a010357mg [Erythranthe guttata]